ncbi:hypothetical protein ABIF68_003212 [Bradyrhizobium japonicum]
MDNRLLKGVTAVTLAAMMALASPVLARGGGGFGGGGHGGFGGGGHFGGGGMHAGGFGGGMRGGGMHVGGMGGGGMRFGGMGGARFGGARFVGSPMAARAAMGPRFVGSPMAARAAIGPRFVGAPLATRAAFGPRFAGPGWHGRPFIGRHAFFHRHRFNRFAFVGAPFSMPTMPTITTMAAGKGAGQPMDGNGSMCAETLGSRIAVPHHCRDRHRAVPLSPGTG